MEPAGGIGFNSIAWQRGSLFVCLFGCDSFGRVEGVGPRGAMVAHQTSDLGVAGSSPAVVIAFGADEHSRDLSWGGRLYLFSFLFCFVLFLGRGRAFWLFLFAVLVLFVW